MTLTAEEFYKKHLGKAQDTDGGYGVQCVDLFKAFTKEQYNISNYTCSNGWASGLWIYRKTKLYYDKFIEVDINKLQDGDWVFWNNGSKSCPNSHVAMYYKGKFFGQSQGGKKEANLKAINMDGVLGALRPKIYIKNNVTCETSNKQESKKSFFPKKGYFKLGDKHENIGKIASFMYKVFPAYTDKKALGNYYGKYIKASIKEFQKRTGLETDGSVGPITLAKLKEYGFKE